MNTKLVAWGLSAGALAVTAAGAFGAEPSLALGSVILGGAALAASLSVQRRAARQKIRENVLEQMR